MEQKLIVKKEDFLQEINSRIDIGKKLQFSIEHSLSLPAIMQFEDEYNTWHSENGQYLTTSFNIPDSTYKKKYTLDAYLWLAPSPIPESIEEQKKRLVNKIKKKITILETICQDVEKLPTSEQFVPQSDSEPFLGNNRIMIVHGHDDNLVEEVKDVIKGFGYEPLVLRELPNIGVTIIEKLEKVINSVGYAVVLYTADDVGCEKPNLLWGVKKKLQLRARQNVVFEHGWVIGKLGRERTFFLVDNKGIDIPGDLSGVVYQGRKHLTEDLAQELKSLGYSIPFKNN